MARGAREAAALCLRVNTIPVLNLNMQRRVSEKRHYTEKAVNAKATELRDNIAIQKGAI